MVEWEGGGGRGGKTGMHIRSRPTRNNGASRTVHGGSYNRTKLSNLLPMQCFDHKHKQIVSDVCVCMFCFTCLVLPTDST